MDPTISVGRLAGWGSSRVPHLMERPLERHPLAVEEPPDHLERLLEPRRPMVERDPEGVELRPVPARAHAEHEPPAAQLVDGRGGLREHRRLVEVQARHERP